MYALILAGGQGQRLRPLTDTLPKPMLPLHGRPILARQLSWLRRRAGITDAVLLVGHLAHAIAEYFGGNGGGSDDNSAGSDGHRYCGVRIHYSREQQPLGRGGALRQGLARLPAGYADPVIALNGDIITDAPLAPLLTDYAARRAANSDHLATILTVPMPSPYGIVDTDPAGLVAGFREKAPLPYAVNAGVYILHPAIRELLPAAGDHETTTFPALAAAGRMSAVPAAPASFWRSIDSLNDLQEAEAYLARQASRHGSGHGSGHGSEAAL